MKNSFYNVEFQKIYNLLKASAKQNVTVVVIQSILLNILKLKLMYARHLIFEFQGTEKVQYK